MKVKARPLFGPEKEYELRELEAMYASDNPEVERLIQELCNAIGRTVETGIEWQKIRRHLDKRMEELYYVDVLLDIDDGTWDALMRGRKMEARARAKLAKAASQARPVAVA
jgi:hypothetical protein